MKSAITLISTMITVLLASPLASAQSDRFATGGVVNSVASVFCSTCKEMNDLRDQVFKPAHRDVKLHARAKAAVARVTQYAEYLTLNADKDLARFRSLQFANEITAFYNLAAEALPYAGDLEIAETIAYLNQTLGSRHLFDAVMNDEKMNLPENSCRKEFFRQAVAYGECELDSTGKVCRRPTMTVSKCEADKILKRARP